MLENGNNTGFESHYQYFLQLLFKAKIIVLTWLAFFKLGNSLLVGAQTSWYVSQSLSSIY